NYCCSPPESSPALCRAAVAHTRGREVFVSRHDKTMGENQRQLTASLPDSLGHFGPYGGRFVPQTLMHPLQQLEQAYRHAQHDPEFQRELEYYLREFCGRPTPLYLAERLTRELGGAKIYLKREDLLHTGAHKINNCIGQILLAKRMG